MRPLKRIYEVISEEHLEENRQMIFLVGPRQVGKTTTSLEVSDAYRHHYYFNWDIQTDRNTIIEGPEAVAAAIDIHHLRKNNPVIIFDELHKYGKWKTFLKGFFDKYSKQIHIIVTGSARLDVYQAGGDSLMGRYFSYRLHPFSVAELLDPTLTKEEIRPPKEMDDTVFLSLLRFGGFPEPFIKQSPQFFTRWKRTRTQQLFEEDIRDLTRVHEIGQMKLLAEIIKEQAGQLTSYTELSKKVNVSIDTIKRWLEILKSFYYCYSIQPWSKNVVRSLLKEPKFYLWDWSSLKNKGARAENFIASHLLKAVHFWTDRGLGDYELYYLRDKEKREVDFLVARNGQPWFLVEAKHSGNGSPPKSLYYFHEMLGTEGAFQLGLDLDYVDRNCFEFNRPIIVPAKTFLSQLI